MVKCDYCGVEFERKYPRVGYAHVFCSREHAHQYASIRLSTNENSNSKVRKAWRIFNKMESGYYEIPKRNAKGLSRVPPNQRKMYLEEAKKLLAITIEEQ